MAAVEDHEMLLDGLRAWLDAHHPEIRLIGTAPSVPELLDGPGAGAAVTLLDLRLPDDSRVADNIAALRERGTRVVVVSQSSDPAVIREAVRAGAIGYMPKTWSYAQLVESVLAVAAGEDGASAEYARAMLAADDLTQRPAITAQQLKALQLFAGDMTAASAARRMGITRDTFNDHIKAVRKAYRAVGDEVPSKLALRAAAVRHGHLPG